MNERMNERMNDDDPALTALLRGQATRHAAGDALQAAIRTQVALADAGRAADTPPRPFGWRSAGLGFGAGVLATLATLGLVLLLRSAPPALEAELVAGHVRALQSGVLAEVASSDRHTVKPWFQGRLDYAPPVFDLAAEGFPLVGGRVEHVRGQPVAALAYTLNRHVVDVFVWPGDGAAAPAQASHRGFSIAHWSGATMQVWVVTDADAAELQRFVRAWRAHETR